jgi:hypothetical protein
MARTPSLKLARPGLDGTDSRNVAAAQRPKRGSSVDRREPVTI